MALLEGLQKFGSDSSMRAFCARCGILPRPKLRNFHNFRQASSASPRGVLDRQVMPQLESRPDDDLLTAREVADLLGWRNTGQAWQQHQQGTFPAPAQQFGRERLWWRSDVVTWATTHSRRPNRRQQPGTL